FDSFATFLKNAAKQRPLLLVFDDLHAADKPSLLLLRFVARNLAALPVLIVGTFRDGEVGRHHPLFQTLGELGSEPVSRRMPLAGLAKSDVARCIQVAAGVPPPDGVVDTVFRETDGNPFFVGEVAQLLASEGGALPTPQSIGMSRSRRACVRSWRSVSIASPQIATR